MGSVANKGTGLADDIAQFLRGQRSEFISLIEQMARAESPSAVPASQIKIRETIAAAFEQLGFQAFKLSGRRSGGMLYARPARRRRGDALQLMLGHYDTVWPEGTLDSMPLEVDGNIIRGPGVYDMKGGIAQMVFALRAIAALGLEMELTPLVFINSDEEIGSHDSSRHIRMLARRVDRVMVLEPSLGPAGALKTGRKAIGRFEIKVAGKAAHAGLNPEEGVSAILELSHVIQKLFALNDPARGITVNVGKIDGGLQPNVVAPASTAVADVRVASNEDAEAITRAIHGLQSETPGTTLEINGGIGRPAMERTPRNQALWQLTRELAAEVGVQLDEGFAGGGSDGNTTSQYTATIDGLGPVGDGAHARHEHLLINETIERAALLTLLLIQGPVNERQASGAEPGKEQTS